MNKFLLPIVLLLFSLAVHAQRDTAAVPPVLRDNVYTGAVDAIFAPAVAYQFFKAAGQPFRDTLIYVPSQLPPPSTVEKQAMALGAGIADLLYAHTCGRKVQGHNKLVAMQQQAQQSGVPMQVQGLEKTVYSDLLVRSVNDLLAAAVDSLYQKNQKALIVHLLLGQWMETMYLVSAHSGQVQSPVAAATLRHISDSLSRVLLLKPVNAFYWYYGLPSMPPALLPAGTDPVVFHLAMGKIQLTTLISLVQETRDPKLKMWLRHLNQLKLLYKEVQISTEVNLLAEVPDGVEVFTVRMLPGTVAAVVKQFARMRREMVEGTRQK